MDTILLVIHLFLAIALVIAVLMQRSEGGALGIGGTGGGMMTGRSQANLLTRATAVLATAFMTTSLALAILAARDREPGSLLDEGTRPAPTAPAPAAPAPGPAAPTTPGAPLGR